jgi:radical SAM/Cys-rich protein
MHATLPLLEKSDFPAIRRDKLEILQANLGYLCNQTCIHCHVNASPRRKEVMDKSTVDTLLDFLQQSDIHMLDLTGGAPEMNPHFRYLVSESRKLGVQVMDRCNLTILEEPGYENMAGFLADNQVDIVASLPCYLQDNVDLQRGNGVFEASINGLKRLNALGYGTEDSGLHLNLVYNPTGTCLPPAQGELEAAYKDQLGERFEVTFNQLFTITNMPIKRFGSWLISKGEFASYMQLLKEAYQPQNLDLVMCKNLINVDWQGYVYDCDFNQMLGLPLIAEDRPKTHLKELLVNQMHGLPIVVKDHCYGCTAGQGSSCGGALDG